MKDLFLRRSKTNREADVRTVLLIPVWGLIRLVTYASCHQDSRCSGFFLHVVEEIKDQIELLIRKTQDDKSIVLGNLVTHRPEEGTGNVLA